jgi:hypothetical protein
MGLCIVILSQNHFLFFTFLAIGNQTFILTQKHYFELTIGFFFFFLPPFFSQLINIFNFMIYIYFPQKYLRFSGGLLIDYGLDDDLLFW